MADARDSLPLALVINAEPATEFDEEVENSPAVLRELRDGGLVQVEALPQLLRVCWIPADGSDAAGAGLENVSGLRKEYRAGETTVQGLELFALCMCILAQEGEDSENKSLLRIAQEAQEPGLYVSREDSTARVLRDLAAGKVTKAVRDVHGFMLKLVKTARLLSAPSEARLVEIQESSEDGTDDNVKQRLLSMLETARDNGSRLVLVRDASSKIVSVLLAVGPADALTVRNLLTSSLESQEQEDIADEAEDETDLAAEDHPVHISFVVQGADEGNEPGLEGELELTMPPLPDDEEERTSLVSELLTRDDDAPLEARRARAWEQLTRALASSGLRLRERNDARVTMRRDAARDDKLGEVEKPATMCVVVTIPADAIRSELPRGPRMADAQPDVAHLEQREIAEKLLRKAEMVMLGPGNSDWAKKFVKVSFVILTPNFNSLQSQTADRVTRARLEGGRVLKHTKVPHIVMDEHREWMEEEAADPGTLLVIIADECHFAPTLKGAHDWLLNNESLNGENVLRLLVSATPQNVLSNRSRVDDANVVRWFKETSLYRSMDYYVETATWAVPDCTQPLELKVGNETYLVDARVKAPVLGHAFRYPMHEYKAFCEVLSAAVQEALPADVSKRLLKNKSFFSFIQGKEHVQMTMPDNVEVTEANFRPGSGLMHWLGFAKDLEKLRSSRAKALADGRTPCYTAQATAVPVLCDTEANADRNGEPADCLPRRRQRVLKDEAFDEIRDSVNSTFGKRGHTKRKEKGIKVAPSTPLFDGHIIMADYLLSLVYLSVYRVDHADLWNTDKARDDIFRALEPEDIGPLSLDDDLLTKFAQHLGFVKKLWPDLLRDPAREVGKFDIAGGVEKASVQHVLDKLLDAMFESVWSELEKLDVQKALRDRLGQPWVAELQHLIENEDHDTPEHWRLGWQYIISEKLTRNREDRTNEQGNTSQTWYNETDRLVHDLLDIDPRYRTGRMAVMRVYETDENLSIQDGLRSALAKLGLTSDTHGGLLSVVADVGGSDGRKSAAGETGKAARRATNLFTQLESWAMTRDLRHPSTQERAPDGSETVEDRVHQSFVQAKEREKADAREKNREPKRVHMTAKYEDLENLPTIVILCEKGRMGDTFPHSFRFLDIRLRSSQTYSTFVQEFGRVCRYPGLDSDKIWSFEVKALDESAMQDDGDDGVNWSSLDIQLDAFFADPGVTRFFAKGGSYALLDPGKEVRFHVDSEFQLRSRLRAALQIDPRQETPRARFGTWIAKRYVHVLPTVLMNKTRFNAQLQQAVEHKYRDAQGHQRIDQCIPGPLDLYVSGKKGNNKKAKRPSIKLEEGGTVVVTNPMHDFEAYRKNQVQSKSSNRGKTDSEDSKKTSSRPPHYDSAQKGEADPRRLLLMAQCQQGKTGTYLHFVRLLKEHIELTIPAPPDPLPPVPKADWILPYWGNLIVSSKSLGFDALRSAYDKPKKGQYHATVMQQRMLALMLASEKSGQEWLQDFVEYLRSGDGEAIQSKAGLEKADSLASTLEAAGAPVPIGGARNVEVAFQCINFDGRFSLPEWRSAIEELLADEAAVKALAAAIASGAQSVETTSSSLAQRIRNARAYVQSRLWDGGARGKMLKELASETASISALTFSTPLQIAYETVAAKSISPSFDGRYCLKQHIVADIKLVGQGASLSAPYDGFHGLSIHADADHVQVFLKAATTDGARTLLLDVEMTEKNRRVTKTSGADSVRWVFVPSYNRAGVALLDYDKAIPKTDSDKPTVVCIVVRSGKQFNDYVAAYGSAHLILGMPPSITLDPRKAKSEVHAEHGGIGYARRFIQRAAHEIGLPWVWILDDNVDVCYQRELFDGAVPPDSLKASPNACTFAEVMSGVEGIVHEEDEAVSAPDPTQKRIKGNALIRKKGAPPQAAAQGVRTKKDLTGGADKYGLIGIRRDAQARLSESEHPFMVTYSVYSFIYLNVASTMAKMVYFPVKSFWEDVEFNHLVDEAGLICLKVNRFFHHKKNLKLSSSNAAARARARQSHFPQLETALEHFRDVCGSLAPVDLLSERLWGCFSSRHLWAAALRDWVVRQGAGRGLVSNGSGSEPLSVPVCLLELANVPAFNTLALHIPGPASAVLLVVRNEDLAEFEELTGCQGKLALAHRPGGDLHVYHEARADEPFPAKLLFVGTDETSPVPPKAWVATRRLQRRASSTASQSSPGGSNEQSSSASSPPRGAKRSRVQSPGAKTRVRRKESAGSGMSAPASVLGRRKSDVSSASGSGQKPRPKQQTNTLDSFLAKADHPSPSLDSAQSSMLDENGDMSDSDEVTLAQRQRLGKAPAFTLEHGPTKSEPDNESSLTASASSPPSTPSRQDAAQAPNTPREGGNGTGAGSSRSSAAPGETKMDEYIRSGVLQVLAVYAKKYEKNDRFPKGVFEHARRMAAESDTFGKFKRQISYGALKQMNVVSLQDDEEAESELKTALNTLKQALDRDHKKRKALKDAKVAGSPRQASSPVGPKPTPPKSSQSSNAPSVSASSTRTTPPAPAASTSGSAKRARPDPTKDAKIPTSNGKKPKPTSSPSTGGDAGASRKAPTSRITGPASSSKTAKPASAASTSGAVGADRKPPTSTSTTGPASSRKSAKPASASSTSGAAGAGRKPPALTSTKGPASSRKSAKPASASSTSGTAGKTTTPKDAIVSASDEEPKLASSSKTADAAEVDSSAATTPRKKKGPVKLTPALRDEAIQKFEKSTAMGNLNDDFNDHVRRTLKSPSTVTSQDVFDQITKARFLESLESDPPKDREAAEDNAVKGLQTLRNLLRRSFGL